MANNQEKAEFVIEAAKEAGINYRPYSGHGMYGRTCIGLDASLWDVATALADHMAQNKPDLSFTFGELPTPCADSLGLGTITYFPYLEWDDDFTDDEDDEYEEDDE